MNEFTQESPVTSAAAVGNRFLVLGREAPDVPPIDQMKLQKLVFYTLGWFLAIRGYELFPEDFFAWPWGPVEPSIYQQTRNFGRSPITTDLQAMNGEADFYTPELSNSSLIDFVDSVWESHKGLSGIQLSNATHGPDEPWTLVKERLGGDLSSRPRIPAELIRAAFQRKLAAAR